MSQSSTPNADPTTLVYGPGRKPDADLPRPGVKLAKGRAAIVVTDPQNDFPEPRRGRLVGP